jgi:transposase
MIQIVPQMRILVAVEAVDFRNGIDGLVRICKQKLGSDPFCGWLFVFANRRRTAIKILAYDQQGFWMCQKRLSTGHFRYWPTATEASRVLEAHELQLLLVGGESGHSASVAGLAAPADERVRRTTEDQRESKPLTRHAG